VRWWERLAHEGYLEEGLGFWKRRLQHVPDRLLLPLDRARPAVQSYRGASHRFALSSERVEEMRSLARAVDVTDFMIWQALFATLLYRASGQTSFCLGSPSANRDHRQFEPLIGLFVNLVVFPFEFESEPTFLEVLARSRRTTLEVLGHRDTPFEMIVETLQPDRDPSTPPLIQVTFALEPSVDVSGRSFGFREIDRDSAKFDLSLTIVEQEGDWTGVFEYNTDLFEKHTIVSMADRLLLFSEAVQGNLAVSVSKLSLMDESTRHWILHTLNRTDTETVCSKCLHHLVEDRAHSKPDQIALISDEPGKPKATLSYGLLVQRAKGVALEMKRMGIGPETIVGISLPRSIDLIIGLLGILETGGAYRWGFHPG